MKTVEFHRLATAEMITAARVYERKREGLGFRFLRLVERASERIGEHPDIGTPLGRKDRRWVISRFPYSIAYRSGEDSVLVLAVMHHHRKPGYWKWRRYRA